jgi:hypothetical protein
MFTDDRHLQVRRIAPTELRRQREPQPAGSVGAAAHLAEQLLPVGTRHTAVVEVGACPLPSMVETDVVSCSSSGLISRSMKSSS